MVKKILLLGASILAAMALLATPVSAQYPPAPSATIDDTSVLAGQAVRITGECAAADTVSLEIEDGPSLGTLPVGDDDTFDGQVTIPSDLAPGEYTLLLTCGDEVLSVTITVVGSGGGGSTGGNMTGGSGSGSGSGDGSLARTGTEVDGLLKAGGGLLVAGAAAVLFATKRRSATA